MYLQSRVIKIHVPLNETHLDPLRGGYLTRGFNIASRRANRRSDVTTFDKNKQIFLSTLPRTGFNTEVCSCFSLTWLDYDPSREC